MTQPHRSRTLNIIGSHMLTDISYSNHQPRRLPGNFSSTYSRITVDGLKLSACQLEEMPSLLDCSPEILCSIFHHLDQRYDISSLHSLCLTHRVLRPIAEKLLYSRLDWVWHTPSTTPPIAAFLTTLHRRPELAGFVQAIVLLGSNHEDGPHWHNFPSPRIMGGFGDGSIEYAVQQVKRLKFPNEANWVHGLLYGHMDALIAYLLFTVRGSLRELTMDANFTRDNFLVANMFQHVLCSYDRYKLEPVFSHLQDVNIIHSIPKIHQVQNRRDNTREVLPYLYLPSLQNLSLTIDNEITLGNSYWPILKHTPPNPSNLQSLNLRQVREGRLGQILKHTNPSALKWQWYYRSDLDDGKHMTNTIDLDQLSIDLSHIRQSLTNLTISATTSKGPTAESPHSTSHPNNPDLSFPKLTIKGNPNSTFTSLASLKTLQIPLVFLLGFSGAIATDSIFTMESQPPPSSQSYNSPISFLKSKFFTKSPPSQKSEPRCLGSTLPPSLEHLTLTDDLSHQREWQWKEEELREVLADWIGGVPGWREFTPGLRGVCVHFREAKELNLKSEGWEAGCEEGYGGELEGLDEKGGYGVGVTVVRGVGRGECGCGVFGEGGGGCVGG